MKEIWKDIDYSKGYQISNFGRVKRKSGYIIHRKKTGSLRRVKELILKPRMHTGGYTRVYLNSKDYYIHRLVAEFFIGIPIGMEINHKNSIRSDNRLSNIEVVTRSQNIQHSYKHGNGYKGQEKRVVKISGENHYFAKFTDKKVRSIRIDHKNGLSPKEIGIKYGLVKSQIDKILYYQSWKHVKI